MEPIHHSNIHNSGKSYEVVVMKHNGTKLKMTYECYNGVERFTGELFVNGKWEHFFSMLDLGVIPNTSRYVYDDHKRQNVSEDLQKRGINFFKLFY